MRHLGLPEEFTLLTQEAHLAKNAILSSFDLLLQANFYQKKDGYFYSGFFNLTIGLERMMKLAVVSDYMLENNYRAPTDKELRKGFGHYLNTMYQHMVTLSTKYNDAEIRLPDLDSDDHKLLEFLSKFAAKSRYYNLDELGKRTDSPSPLQEWWEIGSSVYEEYTAWHVRERQQRSIFQAMDTRGIHNGFTREMDFDGQLMTVFDVFYRQHVTKKSASLMIWRILELFRPVHDLLDQISHHAHENGIEERRGEFVIPHFSDFFYFFNADRDSARRRKRWLTLF